MPPQNNTNQPSPFSIVSPKKSKGIGKTGIIVGSLIAVFLTLSVVAGVLLVKQQQTVTPEAVGGTCPGAGACPHSDNKNLLSNCYPAQSDNTPQDSQCDQTGRVAPCGPSHTNYCCPKVGGNWTTDMTACNASPTPTATPTPTVTPTPTATSGTGSACNGSCGSNSNCGSGLYCYSGYCRNPLCADDTTCGCGGATETPTPTATPTTPGSTTQATARPIPVTGTDWPTVAGVGVGILTIVGSVLLAI